MTATPDETGRIMRDLAWAINSPEPTLLPDILPWRENGNWFAPWLQAGGDDIRALANWRGGRLGKYVEALWQCYLNAHPQWHLRLDHFPVYADKRTVGELDFVLEDAATNALLHIELAVKFFLYIPTARGQPTTDTAPTRDNMSQWVGPNLQDSLARKYYHLNQHQLALGTHPSVVAELGRPPDRSRTVLKGRFFMPYQASNPNALPQWLTWSDARHLASAAQVWPLPRAGWLTGSATLETPLRLQEWLNGLQSPTVPTPGPAMVQLNSAEHPDPVWRFVVPDNWPERARAMVAGCDPVTGRPRQNDDLTSSLPVNKTLNRGGRPGS